MGQAVRPGSARGTLLAVMRTHGEEGGGQPYKRHTATEGRGTFNSKPAPDGSQIERR